MVKDEQVRRLFELIENESIEVAAARTGMSPKTARRYRRAGRLPSDLAQPHTWRTRSDPFVEVWDEIRPQLELNDGLQAKTLFAWLQRRYPGRFQDGQLRTLQRRIKLWRATEGPPSKEVFFAQVHRPGELCQSDFTHMTKLGVRIGGRLFEHLIYHFVLTYSNWETFSICFSESFESLSAGLQASLWELGGVPALHRTDRMSLAVCNSADPAQFTARYRALMKHYELKPQMTQGGKGNENGDVEQRHYRFREAVDQALMLRGSRDFEDRASYEALLREVQAQLNAGRSERLAEERALLSPLPVRRLDSCKVIDVKVRSGSLIYVDYNIYSVDSRLIDETVRVRLHADHLELWYGQKQVDTIPRLRGRHKHRVDYRHVIDWLVRKPGAFANYRYREDLFPSSWFRMAYDALRRATPDSADRVYLKILKLAAGEGETRVEDAIRSLLDREEAISLQSVECLVQQGQELRPATDVYVEPVELAEYDSLLDPETREEAA